MQFLQGLEPERTGFLRQRLAHVERKRLNKTAYLNFGGCIAFAPAKETGEELLFKRTGFAQTDIAVAAY